MRNRPYGSDVYQVNFKTLRTIAHIFVAFSEKLNFMPSNFGKPMCFPGIPIPAPLGYLLALKMGGKGVR